MDDEQIRNLQKSTAMLGFVVMALQDFTAHVLGHSLAGTVLSPDLLNQLRSNCITRLKNSYAERMSMDDEVEVIGEAIHQLEQLIDGAIAGAREAQK